MNHKLLDEVELEEYKVKYYMLMIEYYIHEANAWEMAQCWYKIYNTQLIQVQPDTHLLHTLKSTIVFLLLSRYDNHQQDMLQRIKLLSVFEEPIGLPVVFPTSTTSSTTTTTSATSEPKEFAKNVSLLASFYQILQLFTKNELIPFNFPGSEEFLTHIKDVCNNNASILPCPFYSSYSEKWTVFDLLLRERVNQHNIRVISRYYTVIRMNRLIHLLNVSEEECEDQLTTMSIAGE